VNATVITGTLLLNSDDLMDPRAQERAKELLTNAAILDVARAGRSFQPVEGDAGIRASKIFTRTDPDGSLLVAVFNYDGSHSAEVKADFARLGLDGSHAYQATDLWTAKTSQVQGALVIPLSAGQSTILRLVKR